MYEDLLKQHIIVEFSNLIKKAQDQKNDLDSYTEFMKETILNTYGVN